MPGLLQSVQPQQAPAQPMQPAQQPQGQVPPEQNHEEVMKRVNKAVLAAQQIMYGEKTSKLFMKQLNESGKTAEERAGNAAAGVIGILAEQSNGKIDPRVIVPAGVIIVADLMDFIGQTEGTDFGEAENNAAIKIFLEVLTQSAGEQQQQQAQPQAPAQPQQPMQGAM